MTRWFTSDTHIGHEKILTFRRRDKGLLRPFQSIVEHDRVLLHNTLEVLKPGDTYTNLGDIAFNHQSGYEYFNRISNRKYLTVGNHDYVHDKDFKHILKLFRRIKGWYKDGEEKIIFCHFPVHESCLEQGWVCVHGHTHDRMIDDPRYVNVCVEATDWKPISLDQIKQVLKDRGLR